MNDSIIRLMVKICNMTDNDPIKIFFFYSVWFIIYSMFEYTIEKLLNLPTIVMWYDLVAMSMFTLVYAYNIFWLMVIKDVLRDRKGKTRYKENIEETQ